MGVGYPETVCAVAELEAVAQAIADYRTAHAAAIQGGFVAPELGPAVLEAEAAVDAAEASLWAAQSLCGITNAVSFWETEPRYSQTSSQGHLLVRRVADDDSETVLNHADTDPHDDHTVWYHPGTLVAGEGYRRTLHDVHTYEVDYTTWVFRSLDTWTSRGVYKFTVDRPRDATVHLVGAGAPGKDPSSGGGGGAGDYVQVDVRLYPNIEYTVEVARPYPNGLTDAEIQHCQSKLSFTGVDDTDYVIRAFQGGVHSDAYGNYGSGAGGDGYKPGWNPGDEEAGQVAGIFSNSMASPPPALTAFTYRNYGGKGVWTVSAGSQGGGGGGAGGPGRDTGSGTGNGDGGPGVTFTVRGTTHQYYFSAGGGGGGYDSSGDAGSGGGGVGGQVIPTVAAGNGHANGSYGSGGGGAAYNDDPNVYTSTETNTGGIGAGGIVIIELSNAVV